MSLPAINSPVKREAPLASPLSAKFFPTVGIPNATAGQPPTPTPGTLPGTPIVAGSIENGATAYSLQTPLASVLAIAVNFPAT